MGDAERGRFNFTQAGKMDTPNGSQIFSRRSFLASAAAGSAVLMATPAVWTTRKSRPSMVIGSGEHRFEISHDFLRLPDRFTWQTTHDVAVDRHGNIYVIHEGRREQPDHPSIFVFDATGKYVRSFGQHFQGGGHGLEVHREGDEEFLYVCAYQHVKEFAKLTLDGEVVWQRRAPMESGVYAEGEAADPKNEWGRDRFLPTNIAFEGDGEFLLADGYGSYFIHRFDLDGKWISHFGGPGDGAGKFDTPHGLWFDRRATETPGLVVCDRAHHTLQFLSAEGEHRNTLDGFGLPANVDTRGNLMVVAELHARVTLLDERNEVVARLGDDVQRVTTREGIRDDPARWLDGKFVHPHDACFTPDGDILVAEWVSTGRVSRLKRVD